MLEQFVELQDKLDTSMVLITHDLGVVAETCSRAVVMYAGVIIEQAPIVDLFDHPRHPYTEGLLKSIPRIREHKLDELPTIPGTVPDLLELPPGCRFADRCHKATARCREQEPRLIQDGGRAVACFFPN